jgi:hypothetical protein
VLAVDAGISLAPIIRIVERDFALKLLSRERMPTGDVKSKKEPRRLG